MAALSNILGKTSRVFNKRKKQTPITEMDIGQCVSNFALNMHQLEPSVNSVVCPISVFFALSMVYLGTDGETRTQLGNVLFGKVPENDEVGDGMNEIMHSLKSVDEYYAKIVWSLANRIYLSSNFSVLPSYENDLKKWIHADIVSIDFGKGIKACNEINAWASEKTKNKIPNVVSNLDPETALILINAIYFKAGWRTEFNPSNTKLEEFYGSEGRTIRMLTMMIKDDDFYYFENDTWQMLGMPYTGDELRMYILLPKANSSLANLEKELTSQKLWAAIQGSSKEEVLVKLPKFKVEKELSLKDPLVKMGVTDMFSKGKADLSRMSSNPVYVSEATHKTFIDVDEQGTEAAGVTVVKIVPMSLNMHQRSYEFIANHPFAFFIVDTKSKAILFTGRFLGW